MPEVLISQIYSDFCLPGKETQKFFNKLTEDKGMEFLRCKNAESIEVVKEKEKILIKYTDANGENRKVACDMVVLAPAIEGVKDAQDIAGIFDISTGEGKFFVEEHSKLSPASTTTEGIFIAGCAQSPKDVQDSVATGQAAAGLILSRLVPGEKLTLEAMVAEIDKDLCSGCKTCIVLCPYKAITYDDKEKHSTVNDALCRGCGTCVASCPSGAIKAKHFTDKQIFAEIAGLLK